MTQSRDEGDRLEAELGITFGLGIDCEALDEAFRLYSAFGGQEASDPEGRPSDTGPECHYEPHR